MRLEVLMPVWLALCDLRAPGWWEPWFPHSAVLFFLTCLPMAIFVICLLVMLLLFLAISIPLMMQKSLSFSCAGRIYISQCRCGLFCVFCLFVWFCFWLFLFLLPVFCFWCFVLFRHRDGLQDCVLVLQRTASFVSSSHQDDRMYNCSN